MPEPTNQITIISDLLKRDPAYKQVIDQLEEHLYNRYMVYLADKPRFNDKTSAIPKPYLGQILFFKNTLELNKIAKKYNLSQEQRDGIPNILWKIFYREAEIKNLPQMLNSELAINNIRLAYQISADLANLYMPISDYLGDISMVIKKWQYEIPAEEFSIINSQFSIKPPVSTEPAQPTTQTPATEKLPTTNYQPAQQDYSGGVPITESPNPPTPTTEKSPITNYQLPVAGSIPPPPIRPTAPLEPRTHNLEPTPKDESIPKVQEAISRIVAASNRINDQMQKTTQEQPQQAQPQQNQAPQQSMPQQATPQVYQPQTTGHISDLEPEYLPDEPQHQAIPEVTPVNKANVIDLKNF